MHATLEQPVDTFNDQMQLITNYAVSCHSGQFRKGLGLPYIVHPFAVLSLVAEWGIKDIDIWATCLCHDIMEENRDITFNRLVKAIGKTAAKYCQELTFFPDLKSSLKTSEQKVKYMSTFDKKSLVALIVKCADRICNTIDFINTDMDYACKYWRKADELFGAMISRSMEIEAEFGIGVLAAMKYSRDMIARQLVRKNA